MKSSNKERGCLSNTAGPKYKWKEGKNRKYFLRKEIKGHGD
jgi:hypothetical protein